MNNSNKRSLAIWEVVAVGMCFLMVRTMKKAIQGTCPWPIAIVITIAAIGAAVMLLVRYLQSMRK